MIFLKGLPALFQQLQVYFAIPGQLPDTFDKAITITRKYAANPNVAAELAKLKSSGMSQNMFPLTTNQPPRPNRSAPICRQFARSGTCSFGARCKFTHTATPAQTGATPAQTGSRPACTYCSKLGHSADVCRKRISDQAASPSVSLLVAPQTPIASANLHVAGADEFSFVFTVSTACCRTGYWIPVPHAALHLPKPTALMSEIAKLA